MLCLPDQFVSIRRCAPLHACQELAGRVPTFEEETRGGVGAEKSQGLALRRPRLHLIKLCRSWRRTGKRPRIDAGNTCDYVHPRAMSAVAVGAPVPNACVALARPSPRVQIGERECLPIEDAPYEWHPLWSSGQSPLVNWATVDASCPRGMMVGVYVCQKDGVGVGIVVVLVFVATGVGARYPLLGARCWHVWRCCKSRSRWW